MIADHAVDFRHRGEHLGLDLRGAAGDHDARLRPLAFQPANRLPDLRHRFAGDRAGIDHDGIAAAGLLRFAANKLGFKGVQSAAECDDLDGHQAAPANCAGSIVPENSKVALPVIST